MTEADVRAIVEALVPEVRAEVGRLLAQERAAGEVALKAAVDPLGTRMAAVEARPHLVTLPDTVAAQKGLLDTLAGRLDALEARALIPGPPGKPGLEYCGVFVEGKTYDRGHSVTYAGSVWHCNTDGTTSKPGDGSKDWTLMVKRGQNGRDGRP